MVRGTMTDMKAGTILGHEGVGIVKELGRIDDRVVIPSTIGWLLFLLS
jgi:threonine dehydrogenase-like Zn-dependent dehydrogenase